MPSVLSDHAGNLALATVLAGNCYLALHETDPTATGRSDTEVAGGGYIRKLIRFAAASGRTRVSRTGQIYSGMPEITVRYLAVWTAISGGYMVFAIALAAPIDVPESGQFIVESGDVALSL